MRHIRYILISFSVLTSVLVLSIKSGYAWEPLGYPYEIFGNAYYAEAGNDAVEEGGYAEIFAEQGIDLVKINKATLNLFGTIFLMKGGDESKDPWNDRYELEGGVKFRLDLPTSAALSWGNTSIGVKVSFVNYNSSVGNDDSETRYIGYVSLGLGGDWKR